MGSEYDFEGVIDLIENKAWLFDGKPDANPQEVTIPEALKTPAAEARQKLIEELAELDDQLIEAYLDGANLSNDDIKNALRRVTVADKGVPTICGSALKNKGIQLLLDAIVDLPAFPAGHAADEGGGYQDRARGSTACR